MSSYKTHPNGGGRIYDNAIVSQTAYIGKNAHVYGNAYVGGNAHVGGNARVCDNAHVGGNAHVYDNAHVYGNAHVCDGARVYDNAHVYGNAHVYDGARVYDNAHVYGNAHVGGNAHVYGVIGKHTLILQGTQHALIVLDGGMVQIGCRLMHILDWLDKYQKIGLEHHYSSSQINEYYHYLQLTDKIISMQE